MIRGLITAIRTLTIIPLPGRDIETFSASLPCFPIVGLVLGLIVWSTGLIWISVLGVAWAAGGGIILLFEEIFLTRCLHLDGLADWADALGSGRNRERRLSVMKDAHLGTFGVVALTMILLAKWVALNRILSSETVVCLLPVMIISRDMMVALAVGLPYARSDEGTASPFVRDARPRDGAIAHAISVCMCVFFGPCGVILFGAGWLITRLLRISFRRCFGGITGDLLGATNEIVETALLLLCALPGESLFQYTSWSFLS
jgi:adenosylcobinamide-GDP ribazoletransferase